MYTEKDLPKSAEVFNKLKEVRVATTEADIETLKTWIFDTTKIVKSVIGLFISESEFKEDPDQYVERLLRYHSLMGGLAGLTDAIHERAIYLKYKELTEQSLTGTGAKKLSAGDREIYAKGNHSDVRGIKKDLEESIRNLEYRIQFCRQSRR